MGDRRFGEPSVGSAQRAEGVPGQERLAGFAPGVSVAFVRFRIPSMAFVGPRRLFRMHLAVPAVGETGTTGMAARSLWFVGHWRLSFGHEKTREVFPGSVWLLVSDGRVARKRNCCQLLFSDDSTIGCSGHRWCRCLHPIHGLQTIFHATVTHGRLPLAVGESRQV
jgi:hypothetical protein